MENHQQYFNYLVNEFSVVKPPTNIKQQALHSVIRDMFEVSYPLSSCKLDILSKTINKYNLV